MRNAFAFVISAGLGLTAFGGIALAWTSDLQTMYVSPNQQPSILALSSQGVETEFARGLPVGDPTGILTFSDGRVWLARFNSGDLLDITGGGDHAASPFPALLTGLGNPTGLFRLSDGQILLANFGGRIDRGELRSAGHAGASLHRLGHAKGGAASGSGSASECTHPFCPAFQIPSGMIRSRGRTPMDRVNKSETLTLS
mgnify:CR=1 FL=1